MIVCARDGLEGELVVLVVVCVLTHLGRACDAAAPGHCMALARANNGTAALVATGATALAARSRHLTTAHQLVRQVQELINGSTGHNC